MAEKATHNPDPEPVSIHKFMINMGVGRELVHRALSELGVTCLPLSNVSYNEVPVLPYEVQVALQDHIKAIPLEEVDEYMKGGYMTARQIAKKIGIARVGVFKHINIIDPNWKDNTLSIPIGKRRVSIFSPDMIAKVQQNHELRHHRQILAIWRSMQTQGGMHVYTNKEFEQFRQVNENFLNRIFLYYEADAIEAYIKSPDKFPAPSTEEYVEIKKNISSWHSKESDKVKVRMAQKILNSQDLIPLTDQDKQFLLGICNSSISNLMYLGLSFANVAANVAYNQLKFKDDWGILNQGFLIAICFSQMVNSVIPKRIKSTRSISELKRIIREDLTDLVSEIRRRSRV